MKESQLESQNQSKSYNFYKTTFGRSEKLKSRSKVGPGP
jgi:hypothetical protein